MTDSIRTTIARFGAAAIGAFCLVAPSAVWAEPAEPASRAAQAPYAEGFGPDEQIERIPTPDSSFYEAWEYPDFAWSYGEAESWATRRPLALGPEPAPARVIDWSETTENEASRTPTTRTYTRADGRKIVRAAAGPLQTQVGTGVWAPIVTTPTATGNASAPYAITQHRFGATFPKSLGVHGITLTVPGVETPMTIGRALRANQGQPLNAALVGPNANAPHILDYSGDSATHQVAVAAFGLLHIVTPTPGVPTASISQQISIPNGLTASVRGKTLTLTRSDDVTVGRLSVWLLGPAGETGELGALKLSKRGSVQTLTVRVSSRLQALGLRAATFSWHLGEAADHRGSGALAMGKDGLRDFGSCFSCGTAGSRGNAWIETDYRGVEDAESWTQATFDPKNAAVLQGARIMPSNGAPETFTKSEGTEAAVKRNTAIRWSASGHDNAERHADGELVESGLPVAGAMKSAGYLLLVNGENEAELGLGDDPLAEAKLASAELTTVAASTYNYPYTTSFTGGACTSSAACFSGWDWYCNQTGSNAQYCFYRDGAGTARVKHALSSSMYVSTYLISPLINITSAVTGGRPIRWASDWRVDDRVGAGGVNFYFMYRYRYTNGTYGGWLAIDGGGLNKIIDINSNTNIDAVAYSASTQSYTGSFKKGVDRFFPASNVSHLQIRYQVSGQTYYIDNFMLYEHRIVECPGGAWSTKNWCSTCTGTSCGAGACNASGLCYINNNASPGATCNYTCGSGAANVGICRKPTGQCAGAGQWSCVGQVCPQTESCNNKDDDCDGSTDEQNAVGCTVYYKDADNDTWGVTGDSRCLCAPSGSYDTTKKGDCNDGNASVRPGMTEKCDAVDDDCDGQTDETFSLGVICEGNDADQCTDGYTICNAAKTGTTCGRQGPVTFFGADIANGNTVHDVADGNSNGTMVGASITGTAQRGDGALNLDGVNDYMGFSTNGMTNDEGTIAYWFRPDWSGSTSVQRGQFQTNSTINSSNYIALFQWTSGNYYFRLGSTASASGNDVVINTLGTYAAGDWVFVAATWSATKNQLSLTIRPAGGTKQYKVRNGGNWTAPAIHTGAVFGRGYNRYHDGQMDEMGTYDYALTTADIDALYTSGLATKARNSEWCDEADNDCDGATDEGWSLTTPCDGPDADVCKERTQRCADHHTGTDCANDGPVAFYPMDDGSGTTIRDTSGWGRNLTRTNETWTAGIVGTGALMKNGGTTAQVLTIADATNLRLDRFTVTARIRPTTALTDWTRLVGKGGASTRNYAMYRYIDGRILCQFQNTSGGSHSCWSGSNTSVPLNTTAHIACSYDGSVSRLWINGTVRQSCTYNTTPITDASPVTIGGANYAWLRFKGVIDEVGIFPYALTTSEMNVLASPTGLPAKSRNYELCDGVNNDCDGATDEIYSALGNACDGPDSDLCLEGVQVCSSNRLTTTCNDGTGNSIDICNGADDDCDGSTDEGNPGGGGNCTLPYAGTGACRAGTNECREGIIACIPDVAGYGTVSTQTVSGGLLSRSVGYSTPGDTISTADDRYAYSVSYGCGATNTTANTYKGWTYRVLDPLNNFSLVKEVKTCLLDGNTTGPDDVSFYMDGVVSDGVYLYPIQWTGAAGAVYRINIETGVVQDLGHTVPQAATNPSMISGQYDSVHRKVFMGSLRGSKIARWNANPAWAPTGTGSTSNWESYPTTPSISGAGVVATDGHYVYVKRWSSYPGSSRLKRLGTGYGNTIGSDQGWVTSGNLGTSLTGFYYGGYFYNSTSSVTQFERVRVNAASGESCDGADNDCDGITDENFANLGTPCDGPDSDLCIEGSIVCSGDGRGTVCSDNTGNSNEVCDGVDNDCDGSTDENFPTLGDSCGVGVCGGGVYECNGSGSGVRCSTTSGGSNAQNSSEKCDYLDNDCDGSTDENYANLGNACDDGDADTCSDGRYVCSTGGASVCGSGAIVAHTFDTAISGANAYNEASTSGVSILPGTSIVPGAFGQGIRSAGGSTGRYIRVPTAGFAGAGWSIALSFKPEASGNYYLSLTGSGGNNALLLHQGGTINVRGVSLGGKLPLTVGAWNDIVITHNAVTGTMRFYRNGVQVSTHAAGTASFAWASDLWLGQEQDCDNGCLDASQATVGSWDNIALFNRPITVAEIQAIASSNTIPTVYLNRELCDGVNNNCLGGTDEAFSDKGNACDGPDGDLCNEGNKICANNGLSTVCNDATGTNIETCNGSDDDCDGGTDEGFSVGVTCDASYDADSCKEGQTRCTEDGAGTICPEGPATLFTFEEVSSSAQVRDWAGDGVDAPKVGTPTYVTGKYGKGMNFTEAQALYSPGVNQDSDSFTFAAWVRPNTLTNTAGSSARVLYFVPNHSYMDIRTDGRIACAFANAGSGWSSITSSAGAIAPAAAWTHIACTFDHSTKRYRVLVNGVVAGTTVTSDTHRRYTSDQIRVGLGYSNGNNAYNGRIDDLALYRYALTPAEVTTSMAGITSLRRNAEICDGNDNNCAGGTDETYTTLGNACDGSGDTDLCTDGSVICNSADVWTTTCQDGTPNKVELCGNNIDDDCDGATDEGFENIGNACDGTDADLCADGAFVCTGNALGLVCSDDSASNPELCNNVDDDCDGTTDELFPTLGNACDGSDADLCTDGTIVCSGSGTSTTCDDATTNPANVETCNGADDDCDGATDEGFNLGNACDDGDADTCADGRLICASGGGTTCGSGAIVALNFDAGISGSTAANLADGGSTNNATITGGTLGAGRTGSGYTLPGGNTTQAIRIPSAGFAGAGWTLSFWFKSASTAAANHFLSFSGATGSNDLLLRGDGLVIARGATQATGLSFPTGTWTHITLTHDAFNGDFKVFLNGVIAHDGNVGTTSFGWNSDLWLGQEQDCPNGCFQASQASRGTYDGIGWWNRPITKVEIDTMVAFGKLPSETLNREICDGDNNNCTGGTDEPFSDLGSLCDGPDGDFCNEGTRVCSPNGLATVCNDVTGTKVETCNGADDDCDGATDETFPTLGTACDGPDGDLCKEGVVICSVSGTGTRCSDGTGTNIESCNLADDDCDGLVDEGVPGVGVACDDADNDLCVLDSRTICDPAGGGIVCGASASPVYTFDGGAFGLDRSGENNDAVTTGLSQSAGRRDWGVAFAGSTGDTMHIPNAVSDDARWTLSFWVKTDNASQSRFIVSRATTTAFNGLLLAAGGRLEVNNVQVFNSIAIPMATWAHVALVGAGTDITYYVNGSQVWSGLSGAPLNWASHIWFGQDQDALNGGFDSNQAYQGALDEVAYFARDLAPADIADLAAAGRVPDVYLNREICNGFDDNCAFGSDEGFSGVGANCDGDDADNCQDGSQVCAEDGLSVVCRNLGPVGLWRFDEADPANVRDYSGSDNHGALNNSPASVTFQNKGGRSALALTQATSAIGAVEIPNDSSLQPTRGASVEGWIWVDAYPTASQGYAGIISKGNLPRNYTLYMVTSGALHLSVTGAGPTACGSLSTGTVPLGQWVHIAATVGGDYDQVHTYYINGSPSGQFTPGGPTCTLPIATDGSNVLIGRTPESNRALTGWLDDVAVFDYTLSASAVSTHASSGIPAVQINAEICDGDDNNCAGGVDETYPAFGNSCDGGDSDLCANGFNICDPAGWAVQCSETGPAIVETCNDTDDDCDGDTDNGFSLGVSCGTGECGGGVTECTVDETGTVCTTMPGGSGDLSAAESCDGLDNNCNGSTDEAFPTLGAMCGTGACAGGALECTASGSGVQCATMPGGSGSAASAEICDGIDNDCDGITDNGFGVGNSCGIGACAGGILVCNGAGTGTECTTDGTGTAEVCDGIDNDCDGDTDDGPSGVGVSCATSGAGDCTTGTTVCGGGTGFDFTNPVDIGDWSTYGDANAAWNVAGAGLTVAGATGSSYLVRYDAAAQGGFKISAVIDTARADSGIVFGFNSVSSHYALTLDGGVSTASGDEVITLTGGDFTTMISWTDGDTLHVEVTASAGSATVIVDNITTGSGPSTAFIAAVGTVTTGLTGVFTNGGTPATWSSFTTERFGELYCAAAPTAELCDGDDNNCDGRDDDGFGVGNSCDGPDGDSCATGTVACDGTSATVCVESGPALVETCNGVDDDCDGNVDEGIVGIGAACTTGLSGECAAGTDQCVAAGELLTFDSNADLAGWSASGTGATGMAWSVSGGALVSSGNVTTSYLTRTVPAAAGAYSISASTTIRDNDAFGLVWNYASPAATNFVTFHGNNTNAPGDELASWNGSGGQLATVEYGHNDVLEIRVDVDGSNAAVWLRNISAGGAMTKIFGGTTSAAFTSNVGIAVIWQSPTTWDNWRVAAAAPSCVAINTPETDICDNLDNDCDGSADEDFAAKGAFCDGGDLDLCETGAFVCAADGLSLECNDDGTAGLLAWFGFDEGTGLTSFDSSAPEKVATLVGPTWTTGVNGRALSFDGVNDYALVESSRSCAANGFANLAGDPAVCGESDLPGCNGLTDLSGAIGRCAAAGGRLCTRDEVNAQEVAGTGCGLDGARIWTSTACGPGQLWTLAGSPATDGAATPEECRDAAETHQVRCCGDVAPDASLALASGAATTYSLEAWVNPTSLSGTTALVTKAQPHGASIGGAQLALNGTGVTFGAADCGTVATGSGAIATGTWTHIVGVYNGTHGSIYIDGILAATQANDGKLCAQVTSWPLLIGAGIDNAGAIDHFFDGSMDQVAFYGRALSPADIAAHFSMGSPDIDADLCDGIDNDCDGDTDELAPDLGLACDGPDSDLCALGTWTCAGDGSVECVNETQTDIVEICDGVDNDCDLDIDESFPGLGNTCALGYAGVGACSSGLLTCAAGDIQCLPDIADYGAHDTVNFPAGIVERGSGLVQNGFKLMTANDRHIFSVAYARLGLAYAGWTWQVFDPADNNALVDQGQTSVSSYYTDGVMADDQWIYMMEWTGGIGRVHRIDLALGTEVVTPWTIPQGSLPTTLISGQIDPTSQRAILGSLRAGGIARWDATGGFSPTAISGSVGDWEAYSTVPHLAGTGGMATDGVYGYARRWASASYPGPADIFRVGTGLNGTTLASDYGQVDSGSTISGVMTPFHYGGYVYLPQDDPYTVTRVRTSALQGEVCDGMDNDCDALTDEPFFGLGDACGVGVCAGGTTECSADTLGTLCSTHIGGSSAAQGPELCDGLDNDCDGLTDEDFPLLATACDGADTDACENGTWACTADQAALECTNEVTIDIAEVCNNFDDDCDGDTDEGYVYSYLGTTSGTGDSCDGFGLCGVGVVECASPSVVVCSSNPDGSASQAQAEICDTADNDCDGDIDEGLSYGGVALGGTCDGIGACGIGVVECNLGTYLPTCSTNDGGSAAQAVPEICDGLDNDCDGDTDNGFFYLNPFTGGAEGITEPCDGIGACGPGVVECATTTTADCSSNPGGSMDSTSPETCNAADDDCDGETDESAPGVALAKVCYSGPAGTENIGLCVGGITTCGGGGFGPCVGEVVPTPADLVCDGLNEDCANGNDEDYSPISCGVGACARVSDCTAGVETSCTPGTPTADDDCDGIDDDCDGETDEHYVPIPCGTGVCSAESACLAGGTEVACSTGAPTMADESLNCDNLDNDCDGDTDENYDDGIACTISSCVAGVSTNTPDNSACDDSEVCTDDICVASFGCAAIPDPTNTPDPAIADSNLCTDLACVAGTSQNVPDDTNIPDDGLSCTTDTCAAGVAQNSINADQCLVGGVCYPEGSTDPFDQCEVCYPSVNQTEFVDTVLSEDWDGPLGPWTFDDFSGSGIGWNVDTWRAWDGTQSLYMGDMTTRDYDNGSQVHAAVTTGNTLNIPTGVITDLTFRLWLETEAYTNSVAFDVLYVEVVRTNGTITEMWNSTDGVGGITGGAFRTVHIDLSAFAGESVYIRWRFDTLDGGFNAFEGAYIDGITLETQCCSSNADCDDGDDACTLDACDNATNACNFIHLCNDDCKPTPANMLVVLDFSGSMNDPADGPTSPSKWTAATDALVSNINTYGAVLNTGLKLFGSPPTGGCAVNPAADLPFHSTGDDFDTLLTPLTPGGGTPMAAGLYAAQVIYDAQTFAGTRYILLITDGVESCGGDVEQAVKDLAAAGTETWVLGFGDNVDHATLNLLADAGGHAKDIDTADEEAYYAASSAADMATIIQEIFGAAAGEQCNGIDDDCDGLTDEGIPPIGCNVACGAFGIAGKSYCETGVWSECSISPETELCNGLDDDCNGVLDDEWTDATGPVLGAPCVSGLGACAVAGVYVCAADGVGEAVCDAVPLPANTEFCDNIDNDCDGATDETLTQDCTTTCGPGDETCIAGNWVNCTAPPSFPDTQCNNIDDDCDGTTDNLYPEIGNSCDGIDSDLCTNGWFTCNGAQTGSECVNEDPMNIVEVCGGGDEDCDGDTDEPDAIGCIDYWLDVDDDTYGTGAPSCLCIPQGDYTATQDGDCDDSQPLAYPGNPEVCDAIDNDCDGQTDENPSGDTLFVDCYEGPVGTEDVGICHGGVRICTAGSFVAPCQGQVVPQSEVCNGMDDNCDGVEDPNTGSDSIGDPEHPCYGVTGCTFGTCQCVQHPTQNIWQCTLD